MTSAVQPVHRGAVPGAPASRPDAERLRERLLAGDERLFRQVVTELTPLLTRLARVHTPTAEAAEDAVQDTWLTVVEKLDTFQGRSTFRTWVCAILIRTARRASIREARAQPFSSVWADDGRPAADRAQASCRPGTGRTGRWLISPVPADEIPEDRLATKELSTLLDAAIATLAPRQRAIITARDVVGMDAAEAAAALGLSMGNQRVLLHRARGKVRTALREHLGEAPLRRTPDRIRVEDVPSDREYVAAAPARPCAAGRSEEAEATGLGSAAGRRRVSAPR